MADTNLVLLQTAANAAQLAQEGQLRNTIIIGVIGLFSSVITTYGTILLAKIGANTKNTADSAKETAETVKGTDGKTTVLLDQTNKIHDLTNSNLSKVTSALEISQTENKALKDMIAQMNIQLSDAQHTLARLRQDADIKTEKQSTTASIQQSVKKTVKEAVVESVKAPVKEAVQESFTREELERFLTSLRKKGL